MTMTADTAVAAAARADPGALAFAVERSKEAGNGAFKKKDFQEAIRLYTQAIAGNTTDHTLFSNRSAAYLAVGRVEDAILDAQMCIKLSPDWAKGYYRLGCAYLACFEWNAAVTVLEKGLGVAPDNHDMKQKLSEGKRILTEAKSTSKAQRDLAVRETVHRLRKIRQEAARIAMMNQYKGAMVAPDYEMDDYEWRPTFMNAMRLMPVNKQKALKNKPNREVLANYLNALADLDGPKQALRILDDTARLDAFQAGIRNAQTEQPGAHTLVIGAGTGILALMAAQAGAGHITSVERSRMMYHMAKQAMKSNSDLEGLAPIHLVDCALKACTVAGEGLALQGTAAPVMKERAEVLVTDLINSSVLGMGLLPAIDYAARHLVVPGARVVPSRIRLFAALAQVGRVTTAEGLDLSALNVYRWYPHHEHIKLASVPHRLLSSPVEVHTLDLQARVDSLSSTGDGNQLPEDLRWEHSAKLDMGVTEDGIANAIVWWFEVETCPGTTVPGAMVSSWDPAALAAEQRTSASWDQACQYFDEMELTAGSKVPVEVLQDKGQVVFSIPENPSNRTRHSLVPRWHFDMVLDEQRNKRYRMAITAAVDHLKEMGKTNINGLDAGAGTGILSMMASRAGASTMVGVEQSAHMTDVGEECLIRNGLIGKCLMLNQDVRRLVMGKPKPDGTAPDLEDPVDLVVAEVFDCGLIGEGALHIFGSIQARLVNQDYVMVPASARVYCQAIEMRTGSVAGFDMSQLNRYRWRPDYEGHELAHCRKLWRPLSDVIQVFSFDFKDWQSNLVPAEVPVSLSIAEDGIVNAVAFWFDLDLDDNNMLSTSPYSEKGATWPQAVQYIQEVPVSKGSLLPLNAKHDTYGISFQVDDEALDMDLGMACKVAPLFDPTWHVHFQKLQDANKQMMKACAQNPLEFRQMAEASVVLASRPHDVDVDCEKAVEFCARIMS